jgi:anthranilate phosphoribosyltransferase
MTEVEAKASLELLLHEADEALISAFLVLLRTKGETFEEVKFISHKEKRVPILPRL